MIGSKLAPTLLAFLVATCLAAARAGAGELDDAALLALPNASASPRALGSHRAVARVWKGRTLASKADEYEAYLNASGIARIRATRGNLGVTLLRRQDGDKTEFVVISTWESIAAVRRFAGPRFRRAVILPRDREYLVDFDEYVQHYTIELDERRR
jgi:heme-degrading monooxygenase HmoA